MLNILSSTRTSAYVHNVYLYQVPRRLQKVFSTVYKFNLYFQANSGDLIRVSGSKLIFVSLSRDSSCQKYDV